MKQAPEARKKARYIGGGLVLLGILMFLSNYFFMVEGFGVTHAHSSYPGLGMALRGIGGMVLLIAGGYFWSGT